MKRHSDKKFIESGILDKLNENVFIDKGKRYVFDSWYYENKVLVFNFRDENEDTKTNYNYKVLTIQLYYQHLNDYKNTLELIYKSFDKVENKKDEIILKHIQKDFNDLIDLRNRIHDGTDSDTKLYEEDHITLDHILDYMETFMKIIGIGEDKNV